MGRRDLSKEKDEAKALYFQYKTGKEIGEALGVNPITVYRWSEEWKEEREAVKDGLIEDIQAKNHHIISDIFNFSLPMIRDSIIARVNEGKPLKVFEMNVLTDILTKFDKLLRLEAGKPTDITQVKPISIHDLKEALEKDKFVEVESKVLNES